MGWYMFAEACTKMDEKAWNSEERCTREPDMTKSLQNKMNETFLQQRAIRTTSLRLENLVQSVLFLMNLLVKYNTW